MSSFTDPLWLEPHGDVWRTTRPFTFEIGAKGSGLGIHVPAGTLTDLGTIPRILWPILPPHEPRLVAAYVVHDLLRADPTFDRRIADAIFLHALQVLKAPGWRAWAMYLGVRVWSLWRGCVG